MPKRSESYRTGGAKRASGPIRFWSLQDRPRERLRSLGPGALSVTELLALLIGSGGADGSAMDVARRVLNRLGSPAPAPRNRGDEGDSRGSLHRPGGSLRRLATLPPGVLESEPGIGRATASRIVAAFELGRRTEAEPVDREAPIRGPADVFGRMGPVLRDLRQEEFHALLLNTQHRVIRDVLVTRGILDASLIHPREVFRAAVVESAAGVILVHNHPSGDPTPSREDRAVTRQLVSAGVALGIPVLDHVVVGGETFVSLAERGGLEG